MRLAIAPGRWIDAGPGWCADRTGWGALTLTQAVPIATDDRRNDSPDCVNGHEGTVRRNGRSSRYCVTCVADDGRRRRAKGKRA